MNEATVIGAVTITPNGGGWYTLSAQGLDNERVQGKTSVEARVKAINDGLGVEVGDVTDQQVPESPEMDQPEPAPEPAPEAGQPEQPPVKMPVPRAYDRVFTEAEKKAMGVKMTRILLEENDDIPPGGLFLGHNGVGYMILPGEPVDVPDFLLNVLNDAISSQPLTDPQTKKVVGYRDRMRFPYRTLS